MTDVSALKLGYLVQDVLLEICRYIISHGHIHAPCTCRIKYKFQWRGKQMPVFLPALNVK